MVVVVVSLYTRAMFSPFTRTALRDTGAFGVSVALGGSGCELSQKHGSICVCKQRLRAKTYVYVAIYKYIKIHICTYISVYIYIYVYLNMYIYMYLHT